MNTCIEQFAVERDKCEFELHDSDSEPLKEKYELYKFHETKLEQMLRAMENDFLQPSDINDLRDNIEFLIENPDDMSIHECLQDEYKTIEDEYLQDFLLGGLTVGSGTVDIGSANGSENGAVPEELEETKEEPKTTGKRPFWGGGVGPAILIIFRWKCRSSVLTMSK